MPRNGSGEYNLPYNWNDDKANGIKVLASRMQNQDQDIATAMTGSVASDGQTALTGNLDFNGNRAVDLEDGENLQDAVAVSQAQTGELQYYGISSTVPLGVAGVNYEVTSAPILPGYVDGLKFDFIAHIDCLADPKIRVGTLVELSMLKVGDSGSYIPLVAGDIIGDHAYQLYYNEIIGVDKIVVLNSETQDVKTGNLTVNGKFSLSATSNLTISSGSITVSKSNHLVDTEGSTATDDLTTIAGGINGQLLVLGMVNSSRVIVIKNGTGNIINPSGVDIAIGNINQQIQLKFNGTNWLIMQSGIIAKIERFSTGAFASGSVAIPFDNSIPQNTEGFQFMSHIHTPLSTTNRLKVDVVFVGGVGGAKAWAVALFRDSSANSIGVGQGGLQPDSFSGETISFNVEVIAGTTSPITFTVRAGSSDGTGIAFNGYAGSALFGGACASSITVTEIIA